MRRSPNTPTQEQRVAKALRFAGSRGITQIDFDPPALDGLAPIRRLASRINDLRDKGWKIDSTGRRLGMARYVLNSEPERLESSDPKRSTSSRAEEVPALLVVEQQPANAVMGWDS